MEKNVIIMVIVNGVNFVTSLTKENWEHQITHLKNVENEHGGNAMYSVGYLNNLLEIIDKVDVNPSDCVVLVKLIMLFFGEEKTREMTINHNELFIHEIETDNIDEGLKEMRDLYKLKKHKLEYNDTILSLN